MAVLSIVVPVYNAERTLEACLRSILGQTFGDLEVICVNDGSTDHSLEVLERFSADPRVKVLSQENAGLSVARNSGMAIAQGEFLSFVDSDDFIHPQYAELTLGALQRYPSAECVLFGRTEPKPDETPSFPTYHAEKGTLYTDLFNDFLNRESLHIEAWRFMYRRSALNGLFFVPGLRYEDVDFTPRFFRQVHVGVKLDAKLYYYVQWPQSLSRSTLSCDDIAYFYWILRRLDTLYADDPERQKRLRHAYYPSYFVLCWKRLQKAKSAVDPQAWNTLRRTLFALSRGFICECPGALRDCWPLRWRLHFFHARLWATLHPSFRKGCEASALSILKQEVLS